MGMIRCAWCGTENYAIDSWCASCSRHLDWPPPSRAVVVIPPVAAASVEPPRRSGRRRLLLLAPAVVAVAVAAVLAPLVGSWLSAAAGGRLALPNTASRPAAPAAATATGAMPSPEATPEATPQATPELAPEATPAAPNVEATPTATPPAAPPPAEALNPAYGDPAASVALFYQAVSSHHFSEAAALWTPRMQAQFPPATFIAHRFAATQRISLQGERTLGHGDGLAIVYVRIVEIIGGQTRYWVGTWQVINTGSGWLLNEPNLRPGT
jgi:hypothetical protein